MFDRSRLSYWALVIGTFAIIAVVSRIPQVKTILTGKIALAGIVTSCNKYVHTEIRRTGRRTEKVAVGELIFYLEGYNKKFRITKSTPVNNVWAYNQLEEEKHYIAHPDSIIVWIPKYQENEYEPTILRIEGDGHLIYSEEQSAAVMAISTIPLVVIGVILIVVGFSVRKKNVSFT